MTEYYEFETAAGYYEFETACGQVKIKPQGLTKMLIRFGRQVINAANEADTDGLTVNRMLLHGSAHLECDAEGAWELLMRDAKMPVSRYNLSGYLYVHKVMPSGMFEDVTLSDSAWVKLHETLVSAASEWASAHRKELLQAERAALRRSQENLRGEIREKREALAGMEEKDKELTQQVMAIEDELFAD